MVAAMKKERMNKHEQHNHLHGSLNPQSEKRAHPIPFSSDGLSILLARGDLPSSAEAGRGYTPAVLVGLLIADKVMTHSFVVLTSLDFAGTLADRRNTQQISPAVPSRPYRPVAMPLT